MILLFNQVNLRVKLIDVVVERIVLLISFDEGSDDFFNAWDTSLLFDLLEGIFDDMDVTDVHIHQVLFLFVFGNMLLET